MAVADVLVPRDLLRAPESFGGRPDGECLRGRPVWRADRLVGLEPPEEQGRATIMLPRLVEAHCHLDKCHTLHRLGDVGGDLRTAIAAQIEDKENWTEADILSRAERGLAELVQAGVGAVRSHVDWGDSADPPRRLACPDRHGRDARAMGRVDVGRADGQPCLRPQRGPPRGKRGRCPRRFPARPSDAHDPGGAGSHLRKRRIGTA